MKTLFTRYSISAGLLVVALSLSAAPSSAKPGHAGISVHFGAGHHQIHGKARRHHRLRRHHGLYRHYFGHGALHLHYYRSHNYGHQYFRAPSGCHPVSKYVYDHYHRRTKVRGTMCFDRHGHGFILPGSRYVDEY